MASPAPHPVEKWTPAYCRHASLVSVLISIPSASLATPAAFPIAITLFVTGFALACASLVRRESPLWATRLVLASYIMLFVYCFRA